MLCQECGHAFDDNPGKALCRTCEDWLVEGVLELYVVECRGEDGTPVEDPSRQG